MVKDFLNKIKDSDHELAFVIKKNSEAGMKTRKISDILKISKQRFNYWIHHSILKREKEGQNSQEMRS